MKSRSECLREYGSDYYIRQKVHAGELFRIDKGIYSEQEYVPDVALLCYKYPNAVVTMDTAFYLYGMTDEIPDMCTMATKREAAPIIDPRVKQIFMPGEILRIGLTETEYKGFNIRIYDRERMLIELVRYKSKLPYNYYKEIIGNYRRILQQLNHESIRDYAEAMPKCGMIIRTLKSEVY
ncbi:MAG: hypothetical protein IKE15_03295 [Clostridia bacterium]|nr:hypothetical protein [Clostridia bacterium]